MLSELKENLLKAGKSEGCISFDDLNDLLPDEIKDPRDIEKIFNFLGDHNIEIVTEENLNLANASKNKAVVDALKRQLHAGWKAARPRTK